jgi:oxygen-dependent protoporphyrinogen oxidase
MSAMPRAVVVGAGVAGLTVGYRLLRAGVDVTVREASDRPGGRLGVVTVGGLELDAGADSFVARKPWAADLCRELRLPLEPPSSSGAYLWTEGGLVRFLKDAAFGIPGDIGDVLRWPGLSRAGRWRAARDLVRAKRKDEDEETLGALLRRRLGDEATDLAVAPVLAGLHAGDVDRLSAPATFPELVAWERAQGSLVRGSQAARRTAGRSDAGPMFLRPRGGMTRLTDALADALGDRLVVRDPVGELPDADAVVLATPAFEAAELLRPASPDAADDLELIRYASTGVVFLVYPEGTADALPDGTGFVVPRGKAPMTACTWLSSKWMPRELRSRAVLRCYVGADGEDDVLAAADADLIEACARHVAALLPLPAEPEHAAVHRWPRSMPQYDLGHLDRVRRIRASLHAGIFVVGNAYDGVGIADTVRGANEAAERVVVLLGAPGEGSTTEEEAVR